MDLASDQLQATELYKVHIGSWINWSQGQILGATTTLTRRDGNLLIAFIALFVTFVGTCFWRIACLVIHDLYSIESYQNGLYHQRQAVLRNSANGSAGLWKLLQITWAWRRNASHLCRRMMPLILFTMANILAFAVAGIFSSKVSMSATNGNEVLLAASDLCGTYSPNDSTTSNASEYDRVVFPWNSRMASSAANYAMECYEKNSTTADCNKYVKPRLLSTATRNASCPFDEKICRSNDQNILLDTGYLNSHYDFGLNTPPSERWLFREILHCAPLATDSYIDYYTYPDAGLKPLQERLYYGRRHENDTGKDAFTYQHHTTIPGDTILGTGNNSPQDYDIKVQIAALMNGNYSLFAGSTDFIPIPELQRNDSDLFIVFLSGNSLLYLGANEDPWFETVGPVGYLESQAITKTDGLRPEYFSRKNISPLGCAARQQFCTAEKDPAKRICTQFLGSFMPDLANSNMFKDHVSFAWGWAVWSAFRLPTSGAAGIVSTPGTSALLARQGINNGFQGPLPSNQWQLEVEHWQAARMAQLQEAFLTVATGPSDKQMANSDWWYKVKDGNSADERRMCRNQKIRTTAYTSFSILGLIIIFALGGLTIIVSYSLEPILGYFRNRRNRNLYAQLEWNTNETLQLQRLAHEELGMGTWSKAADAVPVTQKDQNLAPLDIEVPSHPRLRAPTAIIHAQHQDSHRKEQPPQYENESRGVMESPGQSDSGSLSGDQTSLHGHQRGEEGTRRNSDVSAISAGRRTEGSRSLEQTL